VAVWAVLTDFTSYAQWNPVFRRASGDIAAGQMITLEAAQPGGRTMTVKPTILVAEPGAEFRWTAGLRGLIGGEHSFVLTPHGPGTRLVQSETFAGLLVPFSGRILRRAHASFRELNGAIRKRAEGGCS
jgi:hypothetical protein